jgi:hypothetical protein
LKAAARLQMAAERPELDPGADVVTGTSQQPLAINFHAATYFDVGCSRRLPWTSVPELPVGATSG